MHSTPAKERCRKTTKEVLTPHTKQTPKCIHQSHNTRKRAGHQMPSLENWVKWHPHVIVHEFIQSTKSGGTTGPLRTFQPLISGLGHLTNEDTLPSTFLWDSLTCPTLTARAIGQCCAYSTSVVQVEMLC